MPLYGESARLRPFGFAEITTPHPNQRDHVDDFVVIEIVYRRSEFSQGRVVRIVFQSCG